MPLLNLPFTNGQPLIEVFLGLSVPRVTAMQAAGHRVPPFVKARLLIDTGASATCVDPMVVAPLGLTPTGIVPIQTPSTGGTPVDCNQFDVSLVIAPPQGAPLNIEAMPIIESRIGSPGIDGLLGRDVLARCVLTYNGPFPLLTFAY